MGKGLDHSISFLEDLREYPEPNFHKNTNMLGNLLSWRWCKFAAELARLSFPVSIRGFGGVRETKRYLLMQAAKACR